MSQEKSQKLNDLIKNLSSLNNGADALINKVNTLKDEQIALHDAVLKVVNIVLNSVASISQIDALIRVAEKGEADQKNTLESIENIINKQPNREQVNSAITNLQKALDDSNSGIKLIIPRQGQEEKGQEGQGGQRGGFKYKRDASARTEVRSQSVSMPARTGPARTGPARTRLIKKTLSSNKRNKSRYTKTFKK